MMKPGQGILKYLKSQGRGIDLPLDQLRQLQEFEKTFFAELDSYEDRGPTVAFGMQSFTKMEALAIALMAESRHDAARRCHEEILALFGNDSAFADGITLPTWVLSNFPATRGGPTLLQVLLGRADGLPNDLRSFIEEVARSRLGIYEVIKDTSDTCRLRELFTDKVIALNQSLGGMSPGSVTLCRPMRILGECYSFGDTPEFPAEQRGTIEGMVELKMGVYFPDDETERSYETFMRLAGPYWFSIVARDYAGDILNPDHYLTYYA